jgi:hypothetical protein
MANPTNTTIAAAASAVALLLSGSAHASEWLKKEPCSVMDRGRPPVWVNECLFRISMAQGAQLIIMTTPDGRRFRLQVDHDLGPWRLNGKRAKEINGGSCFGNGQVTICREDGAF